jgi:hypothetical protein
MIIDGNLFLKRVTSFCVKLRVKVPQWNVLISRLEDPQDSIKTPQISISYMLRCFCVSMIDNCPTWLSLHNFVLWIFERSFSHTKILDIHFYVSSNECHLLLFLA